MADDRQNRIRQRAHEIWEQEGRPEGAHERHWRQAENEVAAADAGTAKKSAAPRKPAASTKAAKPAAAKPAKAAAAPKPKTAAKPKASAKKG
jgi:hypothetical protein